MKKSLLWVLGGFVVTGVLVCGLGYAVFQDRAGINSLFQDRKEAAIPVREVIHRATRLKLPPSATIAFFHSLNGGPDGYIEAKLRFPSAELPKFLAQSSFKGVEWKKHDPKDSIFEDQADSPTWTPSRIKKGRSSQFAVPSAPSEYLRILIDESSATETEVYLNWFQT